MKPVVTADEMRALDRATIDDIGLSAVTLMETAGRAVADAAVRWLGEVRGHVAVVCGPGNNGGDGFVVARVLRDRGLDAAVYLAVDRAAIRGEALVHLGVLERAGGVVHALDAPARLDELGDRIAGAALVIDALFGIGANRAITGHLADVVAHVNRAARCLAVDIPSGLDADTGAARGAVVRAHRTVTLGALKIALVGAPGFTHAGEVEVGDIGIPRGLITSAAAGTALVEEADVRAWLPRLAALDHKGTRGHVLVIGGAPTMRGAGRLAATAALRAGAGLVTLAGEGEVVAPDVVMTVSLPSAGGLAVALAGKDVVVIGCGLGTAPPARVRLDEVLAAALPAVLDADALNLIAGDLDTLARAPGPLVLTPHPGEAARLLGTTTAAIEADRQGAVRTLATRTRAVVVLKGARTVVCDGTLGDTHVRINPTGGPALATGGAGDVFVGVIGALLAQGLAPVDAAAAGVFVHGRAGERLGARLGRGTTAADLPLVIAEVIAAVLREIPPGAPTA